MRRGLLVAMLAMALGGPAHAADLLERGGATAVVAPVAPLPSWRLVDELRAGVFAHDPESPEGGSADVNLEALSRRLPIGTGGGWQQWLAPRLHVGGTINTAGKTSQAYFGLTWTVDVTRWLFVEASFGGAANNGYGGLKAFAPPGMSALGCNFMFRESASAGLRLDEHWSVMATIEHTSNAGLCNENRGLTNFGGRLGYRF